MPSRKLDLRRLDVSRAQMRASRLRSEKQREHQSSAGRKPAVPTFGLRCAVSICDLSQFPLFVLLILFPSSLFLLSIREISLTVSYLHFVAALLPWFLSFLKNGI